MTSIPQCFMQCKYFKDNLEFCEKYKQISKEVANGKKECKEYKKQNSTK